MTYNNGVTRLLLGDCREVLATLPEQSVHMCVTSPPYWGLRSYKGAAGTVWGGDAAHAHEWQETPTLQVGRNDSGEQRPGFSGHSAEFAAKQTANNGAHCPCGAWRGVLGSEPTPEQFVQNLVEVLRAVKRVLRDDGTLWVNLGVTYAGSGGAGGDYAEGGLREGQPVYRQDTNSAKQTNWPAKCMIPIPWMVGLALIQDGWILRSEIIWDKPAPMPESVTDRPTKSHEQILLLSKRPRYYYDAEAVREAISPASLADGRTARGQRGTTGEYGAVDGNCGFDPSGRNARTVWKIGPEPSPEAHYAMFPSDLPRRCILAGTSERGVCATCGAPWVRELERKPMVIERSDWGEQAGNRTATSGQMVSPPESRTTGWTPSCTHVGEPVPATVLDCFMGTGTTNATAQEMGRRSIGIELSSDYMKIAVKRLTKANLAFAGA